MRPVRCAGSYRRSTRWRNYSARSSRSVRPSIPTRVRHEKSPTPSSSSTACRPPAATLRNARQLAGDSALAWRPGRAALRLDPSDGKLGLVRTDRERKERTTTLGRPDRVGVVGATPLAKRLSPFRLGLGGGDSVEP